MLRAFGPNDLEIRKMKRKQRYFRYDALATYLCPSCHIFVNILKLERNTFFKLYEEHWLFVELIHIGYLLKQTAAPEAFK